MIDHTNFFRDTVATFKGCKIPSRKPDYISYSLDGEISSMYWYNLEKGYVIRASDHWSEVRVKDADGSIYTYDGEVRRVASCLWSLYVANPDKDLGHYEVRAGKCYFRHFSNKKVSNYRKVKGV